MRAATESTDAPSRHARRRDVGSTMIEIVISIALIGGIVAGAMTAMQSTIVAGSLHLDHSVAHGWLQSASDVLYAEDKTVCDASAPDPALDRQNIITQYETALHSVPVPQDWQNWQIAVTDLQFWNSFPPAAGSIERTFGFATTCEAGLELQLVEIEVRNPQHEVIETVEIVK